MASIKPLQVHEHIPPHNQHRPSSLPQQPLNRIDHSYKVQDERFFRIPKSIKCPKPFKVSVSNITEHPHILTSMSSTTIPSQYDVIIVGSGNAGFSAALSARENGAERVLLVDKCPPSWAGGNTYFTAGAFRTVFKGLEDVLSLVAHVDAEITEKIDMKGYSRDDFWGDLMRVTDGRADPELSQVLVDESRDVVGWLARQGIKFQLSFNRYF